MKKLSMTSFLIAFLLAAAVCTHGKAEEVKDSNGNPVVVGEKYFIRTVTSTESNLGGGLAPGPIRLAPSCPLGIAHLRHRALQVSFGYPYIIGRDTIDTSSDINIEFRSELWPYCDEFSKLWAVDVRPSAPNEHDLIIGGERKSPNSAFKIEKATGAYTYKLTTSSGTTVGTIPWPWTRGTKVIVTNDEAKTIFVKFVKDTHDDATTTTSSRVDKLGLRMFPFY